MRARERERERERERDLVHHERGPCPRPGADPAPVPLLQQPGGRREHLCRAAGGWAGQLREGRVRASEREKERHSERVGEVTLTLGACPLAARAARASVARTPDESSPPSKRAWREGEGRKSKGFSDKRGQGQTPSPIDGLVSLRMPSCETIFHTHATEFCRPCCPASALSTLESITR